MVSRPAAVVAARRLYVVLADTHGVLADVHDEAGDVVVISVGPDLLVRCERGPLGLVYRWWTGRYSRGSRWRRRPIYACCPVRDVVKAAGGIYRRYLELWPVDATPSTPFDIGADGRRAVAAASSLFHSGAEPGRWRGEVEQPAPSPLPSETW